MEYQDILMQKLDILEKQVSEFVSVSGVNFTKMNKDIEAIKEQTTMTNSRVNKLEDRTKQLETIEMNCPAKVIEERLAKFKEEMSVYVFIKNHWKIAAAFLGIIFAVYSTIMALATNLM